ncbi:MAG: hypothetical protein ACSLE7_04550 [Mycobacterium sp.]
MQEPVAGQHGTAQQQRRHASLQPVSLAGVGPNRGVGSGQARDPLGALVGPGGDPALLPAVTRMDRQPVENRCGAVDVVGAPRSQGLGPDRQRRHLRENLVDRQPIDRADPVDIDELVVVSSMRGAAVIVVVADRHHRRRCTGHRVPPNSTVSASES